MAELNLPEFPLWWQVRFWEEGYQWNLETGCLEAQGKASRFGYARCGYLNGVYFSHRVAYYLYYGIDPGELLVRHLCHNRRCANPRHLALGTHEDNSRDMVEAGRSQTGENHWTKRMPERLAELRLTHKGYLNLPKNGETHPATKLTAEKVRAIKLRALDGIGNKQLAEEFGVTHSNISAIVLGKSWAHVDVPTREKDETFVRKLDKEEVEDIRIRLFNGESQASIARIYRVGATTIYSIANDITWTQ